MYLPYVVGTGLSLGVALFARRVGLDRDRASYATLVIIVASYYVLFAAVSGSVSTILMESIVMIGFCAVAVMGFKSSQWLLVMALAGHGIFDAFHGLVIANTGMPPWWPAFCGAYDVGAAAALAWFLRVSKLPVGVRS